MLNRWGPSVEKVTDLLIKERALNHAATPIDGMWVPARRLGDPSMVNRFKVAWLVFTGKADALVWPEKDTERRL